MTTKLKFNKKVGKKILALLLSVLTVFTCITPVMSVLADSSIKDVWSSSGMAHHRLEVDGKDAFCINYGASSSGKFKTDSEAVKYWNALGSSKKNKIQNILSCAGAKGYLNGTDAQYFGIQRAIWKVVTSKSEKELSDYFKSQTKDVYETLISNCSKYSNKKPNFGTIKLEPQYDEQGNVTSYKGSATDSNGVLSKFDITDKAGLTTSISGNKLTVKSSTRFDGKKTIKMTAKYSRYTISDSQVGHFGDQQVIATGSPSALNATVGAATTVNFGSIQITKVTDSNEPMSDVQFNLYDSNGTYISSDWTDESGSVVFMELVPGTYTVTEVTPAGYVPYGNIGSVQVTVVANQTTNVANHPNGKWVNTLQRGDIYIHKTIEDTNTPYQAQFTLYDSDGNYVLSGTTNTAGDLYFCNVPIGYYQLKETNTFNGNVIDWQKVYYTYDYNSGQYVANKGDSIYVAWDGQTSYPYANQVCHNGWLNDNDDATKGGVNLCDWYNLINYSGENTIVNRYKRGDLRLHKLAEEPVEVSENGYTYKYTSNDNVGTYKSLSGATFTATSYSNQNVLGRDLTFTTTTGADGYAYFCDMPIGVYTVQEVNTDSKYVQPASQTFYVDWDGNTSYDVSGANFRNTANYFTGNNTNTLTFINYLKYFRFEFSKLDETTNSSTAQGDASLAGAVYELYKGDELVGTYTTDAKGKFTTKYHVCGSDYYLKEKSSSSGYFINPDKITISEDCTKYTARLNDTKYSQTELEKYGKIEIIKHYDPDDATQIEQPEEGAEFQVYLKSAGSYDNAKDNEKDYLVTDKDGHAVSKKLPYGDYVIHQTKSTEGTLFVPDKVQGIQTGLNGDKFYSDDYLIKNKDVSIEDTVISYKYLMLDTLDKAYIKLVKEDSETGKIIPYNELQGAVFQILDKDLNVISMTYTYPKKITVNSFTINDEGYIITPQKLKYGTYYLVEVQSPYGYYNPNGELVSVDNGTYKYDANKVVKTKFKVDTVNNDYEVDKSDKEFITINIPIKNTNQYPTLSIEKRGEVFSSVIEKDNTYYPVYQVEGLKNAVYAVTASEDIVTPDGTVRYKKGQMVCKMTTGENGIANSQSSKTEWLGNWKHLYLGKYEITEIKAPYGYILNSNTQYVEFTYQGQNVETFDTSLTYNNDRQTVESKGNKQIEVNKTYGIGDNGEIQSVVFGLFASEDIVASDGKKIPKDGLIQAVNVSSDGTFGFDADLPIGHKYYVKEIATDNHYILDDTKYPVDFEYKGQDVEKQTININDNKVIKNSLKYGKLSGLKKDDLGNKLQGVTFGLFKSTETKFTKDTAIVTTTTDKNGKFEFTNIPVGDYKLVELKAPKDYVFSKEPVAITVSEDKQTITKEITNILARGQVKISKEGEVFYSVKENEDGTQTPIYKLQKLAGVVFDIVAAKDIVTPDGVVRAKKGDVVDTITTNDSGYAESKKLFLGEYTVKEVKTPAGYYLDTKNYKEGENLFNVTLEFENSDKEIVVKNLDVINQRQRAEVSLLKSMEKDETFNIDGKNEIKNVVFGLFAKEDMTALDGSQITKDSVIALAKPDENGKVSFNVDLPYGYKYYVKEMATDIHYSLNEAEYEFSFDTKDNSLNTQKIALNDSKEVVNELKRGTIIGHKTSEDGTALAGATFGLFYSDCTQFTADNAIMTATSDTTGTFKFEYVDYGKFIIREIQAPAKHALDTTNYEVSIQEHNQIVNINVSNKLIRATVIVTKIDKEYPDNKLSGATFAIFNDVNENGIYDENIDTLYGNLNETEQGIYKLSNIPYGHYLVKETEAPKGFELDNTYYPVFICEDQAVYNIQNNGECFINNALTGTLKVIKKSSDGTVEGFDFLIKGVSDSGTPVEITATTNADGEIVIPSLRTGTYTISEVQNKLSKKYITPKSQTVTILEGKTTTVNFFNKLKDVGIPKTGTNIAIVYGTIIVLAVSLGASLIVYSKRKKNSTKED